MKKFALIFAVAATLFACKSDDDNSGEANVEGSYTMVFFGGETAVDFNADGSASANWIEETNCYQDETIVFSGDMTGVINSTSYADITADVDAEGNVTYSVNCIPETEQDPFTYVVNGNTVTITSDFLTIPGEVNGDQITFTIVGGTEVEVADGNGGTTTLTEDLTVVYEKN